MQKQLLQRIYLKLAIRLLKELPNKRNAATPVGTGVDVKSGNGFRAAEQHPLGAQHQLETREPMADQPARQAAFPALHATFANIFHWRICPAHSRTGQRSARQRLLHRRL